MTLEDEALVEAESDTDEDDEEADESEDSLTYSNESDQKIVAMATREVPHVLGMKGNSPCTLCRAVWCRESDQGRDGRGHR